MPFSIQLTPSAIDDLDYLQKRERRIVSDGIALFLKRDADVESNRRKPLRPNAISKWELRIRDYRVFYDVAQKDLVKVVAVGRKRHNDLYIRGQKVDI